MPDVRVSILGDGQMGLVLADALIVRGAAVRMWGPFPEHVDALASTYRSDRLPGFQLPRAVELTADDGRAATEADLIINAVPTQFIRRVWGRLIAATAKPIDQPIICVAKGIENDTLLRPSEIIADAVGRPGMADRLCALSGPTIAAELAQRLPASMVAASTDADLAAKAQDLFDVPWLRIYTGDDVIGVEIAGAAKNVIALAAGMCDGLGVGFNAKSALLARGLAEIARLGAAMGAKAETLFGLAGVGDLATTCFSPLGRNRSCGEALGRGIPLDEHLASTASVVEGVPTTASLVRLADDLHVDLPITRAVHAILFEGLTPREAIRDLMQREHKAERIG